MEDSDFFVIDSEEDSDDSRSSSIRVSVVCFDLGGVVVRATRGGWVGACKRAGLPLRKELELLKGHQKLAEMNNDFEMGTLAPEKFIQALSKVLGYTQQELVKVIKHWLVGLYPGAEDLLQMLHRKGITMACLSNTNPIHWHQMTKPEGPFAALNLIEHRFASHLIGTRKPDLEAYEHVENALGVNPEEILFFDDLADNIRGAEEAYWRAERIDPNADTVAQILKHLKHYQVL